MRTLSFLAISTFILSAFAQDTTNTTFNPLIDNYPYKTTITNATANGFTIDYRNYYKFLTNTITKQSYCLISGNQPLPSGCAADSSFYIPVTEFNIESDSYAAVPFIELLNLQGKLSVTLATQNITSPCLTDGSRNPTMIQPQFIFSQTINKKYVSFSGNDDTLGPLQKASWLLYIGAFFDMELEAFAVYNQIANNYNCHKSNLGAVASPKVVSWTSFDPASRLYTIHGEDYYAQLAEDAGAVLRAQNRLQDNTFSSANPGDIHTLALTLSGSEYIIDVSQPTVSYDTWYTNGGIYFPPNSSYAHISAIADGKVYTNNGIVSTNNISDWTQKSAARPDLALLDLIKLLYPSFGIAGDATFPVWLTSFPTMVDSRKVISASTYGNCSNIASSAYAQTACTIGGNGSSQAKKSELTTGGKAGISVGAVLFVIVAALAGIWLFRKYRRNQRHNFYRMHDLQG